MAIKETMRNIWGSAKTQTDIVALKMKKKTAVSAIEAELMAAQYAENAVYARLGRRVYALNGAISGDSETQQLLGEAEELKQKREEIETRLKDTTESYDAQIAALTDAARTGCYTVCSACGAHNSPANIFCSSCGARLQNAGAAEPAGRACPACGTVNADDSLFCTGCGTKLPPAGRPARAPDVVVCAVCGAQTPADSVFCMSCGHEIAFAAPAESERSDASGWPDDTGAARINLKKEEKSAPAEIICAKCGTVNVPDSKLCITCGHSLPEQLELKESKGTPGTIHQ